MDRISKKKKKKKHKSRVPNRIGDLPQEWRKLGFKPPSFSESKFKVSQLISSSFTSIKIRMEPRETPRNRAKLEPNWLDLPPEVTLKIFTNIEAMDLLRHVQLVCSPWRAIAQDPQLYRVLDLCHPALKHLDRCFFAKLVIDKSRGNLVECSIDYSCSETVLRKLMHESPRLKCLRLANCGRVGRQCVTDGIQQLPLLEEIEFSHCFFSEEVIEVTGQSCPKLRSFRLNHPGLKFSPQEAFAEFNKEAFTIAENMNPDLRSLHLFGNLMTNAGLEAILERFSRLEYLDLRQCFCLDINEDLLRKCGRIKTLRLPEASTEDYEYDATVGWITVEED